MMFFILLLIGLLGGALAGLLGVGGGIIFVPTLMELAQRLGLQGKQAIIFTIANSIFLTLVSGLSGSYKQYRKQNFFWQPALFMGLGGAVASVLVSAFVVPQPWYNKNHFAQFFSLILLFGVYKIYTQNQQNSLQKPVSNAVITTIGVVAGGIAAVSGLGGGIVMIPLMTVFAHFPLKKATSVSLAAIVPISLAMVLFYTQKPTDIALPYSIGILDFKTILPLAIGIVLGAPQGVAFAAHLPEKYIRTAFLVLSILVIAKLNFFS